MRRCLILECLVTLLMIFGTRGLQIDCDFKVAAHDIGDVYTCKAIKLVVTQEDDAVDSIGGVHLPGKSNSDVRVLHVDEEMFNFFPPDIDNFFPNLKGLKIVNSGLKTLTQDNLKFLPDLIFVDFSGNEIETLDSGLFTFNSRLQDVTFDANKLKTVGHGIFDSLEELKSVSMKDNACIDGSWSTDDEIAAMKEELEKCSNDVPETLVRSFLPSLPSLGGVPGADQVDSAGKQVITKITEFFFGGDISEEVTCDPAKVFWKFSAGDLNTCTIDTQPIASAEVKIKYEGDQEVEAVSFSDNKNLRFLPKNIGEVFPRIVELAAKHTYLESISENNFKGLGSLKKLSLSNNDLTVIENNAFAGLDDLEELDLSEGNIQFIEEDAFKGLKSLKTLQIGGNKLRFLPANLFEGLTELRNFSIEHNHLAHLDENLFSSNTKLVNIWLNGNKIKVLSPKVFADLSRLAYIDLQDNDCVDGVFETSTIVDMQKVLEKNCSSSFVIHQTFKQVDEGDKSVKMMKTGGESYDEGDEEEIEEEEITHIITYRKPKKPKVTYSEDFFEIEAKEPLVEDVYTIEVTGEMVEEEDSAVTTEDKPDPTNTVVEVTPAPDNKIPDKVEVPKGFCRVEEVRWRFSAASYPTCIVENLEVDSKEFKITDPVNSTGIQGLVMVNNKQMKFLPENLAENFKDIVEFAAQNSSLVFLSRKNFEGLEKLKTLNLANNNIKFIEPDTFDDLRNLEELDLSGNQMEYIDENVFLRLKSLKMLQLDDNKLHFIHAKLFRNLRNLVNVSISGNQLSTLDDFIFKTNQKLQNIWIDDNKIKTLSPKLFSGKKALELVDLQDNKCIDAVYTKEQFAIMKEEVQAKCGKPYVLKHGKKDKKTTPKKRKKEKAKEEKPVDDDELKEVLCENEDVFWPSLNQTLLTCVISADQVIDSRGYTITVNGPFALPFIDGRTVQALSFSGKNVKFLPENIQDALPNLLAMSVPENSLESVTKSSLKNLSKLKHLNLSGNKLKSIDNDAFDDLWSLEELNIDDNEFETIEETIFIRTKKIKKLKISGNKIHSFDQEIFEVLTDLEEVTVELEDPTVVNEDWFKFNPSLRVVNLNGKVLDKRLKAIDADDVEKPSSIDVQPDTTTKAPETNKKLSDFDEEEFVEETSCEFKETTAFDGSKMFTCLIDGKDTSGNYDIVIKDTPDLKRVKRIAFDNNKKLKNLPENLAKLFPEVVDISAANTNLVGVSKRDLEGLANLKFMNLSRNNIKHLEPNTLDDLENLEIVDLSDNEMEFVEETLFYRPKNLKSVDLSANKLHYVHPKTFRYLENLEIVNMSGNALSVIEPFTFKLNRKLKNVDLGANVIESLNPKIVSNAKDLQVINFKGNKCIDRMFEPADFEEMKTLIAENCKEKAVKDDLAEVLCEFNADDNSCTIEDKTIKTGNYTVKIESDHPAENVRKLIFKGPGVKFLPLNISESFPNVEFIETIDVDLDSIGKKNFKNIKNLRELKLKGVKTVNSHTFDDLTSLETLVLETDADELDEELFHKILNLKVLHLTGKQMKSIPLKLLEKFTLLEDVKLVTDPTSGFDFYDILSIVYQNNPKLKRFVVNGEVSFEEPHEEATTLEVKEEETTQKSFKSSTTIKTVRPDFNEATTTTRRYRTRSQSKTTARLRSTTRRSERPTSSTRKPSSNGLKCILGYSDFPFSNKTLITCDLEKQVIDDSDTVIEANPYSNYVDGLRIDNNKNIKFLPEKISTSLPNLIEISAKNSSIESIFKDDFADLQKLKALNLSGNKIQSIEPETFSDLDSLELLDLSDNEIDYIDETAFPNLKNLKTLDLKNNRISFLPPNIFANLTALKRVFLAGNYLPKDFDYKEFFKKNPKVKVDEEKSDDQQNVRDRRPTTKTPFVVDNRRTTKPTKAPADQDFKVDFDNLSNDVVCNYDETYWIFDDSSLFTCSVESAINDPSSTIRTNARNSRVKGLNFIDNKNVHYLPQNLGKNLPNLVSISGYNSDLESIPSETFNNLIKVRYLNLAKNNLKSIEPKTFKDLESLEELDLSDNQIEYLDESIFENLPQLRTLYLGGNRLNRLPTNIFHNLHNLKNLSLENNRIEKVDPLLFERNKKMETLWLNGNKIKHLSPRAFDGLTNLEYVDLQGNACIDQYFDGSAIVQMRNEIYQRCREHGLHIKSTTFRPDTKPSIPNNENKQEVTCNFVYNGPKFNDYSCIIENQPIFYPNYTIKRSPHDQNVEVLKISGRSVRHLPKNFISLFPKLREILITNTMVDTLEPSTFANAGNLVTLELTDNNFYKSFDPAVFRNIPSLDVLDLSHNRISNIPQNAFPQNLKILSLSTNKIDRIDPRMFENLPSLTELHLEFNKMKEIPKNIFENNKNLEKVVLAGNVLSVIDSNAFDNLPKLTQVDLIENSCISGLFDPATFGAMKNEISRNCQESSVDEVDSSLKPSIDSQTKLDPSEDIDYESSRKVSCDFGDSYSSVTNSYVPTCNINGQNIKETSVTFEAKPQNKRVKRMIFNENKDVEFLPENIGDNFPELLELEVVNGSINTLKPENFKNLQYLKVLDLAGNDIEFVYPAVFDELTSLEHLDLSRNDINFFGHQHLKNLKNLDLADNEISFLSSKTFAKLPSLKTINLQNNKLTGIGDEFDRNPLLEDLNLSRNLMTSISTQAFKALPRLKRLNLQENKCIDQLFNDQDNRLIQQKISDAIQHTCQLQDNILISLNTCTREKEICQRRLSLRSDNGKSNKTRKENAKLRATLKRYEIKITQLNEQQKKIRNAINYEKNFASKLKQKNKELQAEIDYLKQNQKSCSSDESFIQLKCSFALGSDGDYICNSKDLKVFKENLTIQSVIGEHSRGKRNADVTDLAIVEENMKFLPDGIATVFPNLQKLIIEDSQLKKIDCDGLRGLNALMHLIIHGNNIASIEPGSFDFNRKLQVVDLSGNHIHELPFEIFSNLKELSTLNLIKNNIRILSEDILSVDNQINEISLQNNELDSIDPRIFKKLRKAKKIDLRLNNCVDKLYEDQNGSNRHELMVLVGEVTMQCSTGDDNFCIGKQIV